MKLLLDMGLFLAGVFLGLLWASVFILPLFYGFPRGIYWSSRGLLKWRRPLIFLVTPLLWSVIIFAIGFLLAFFTPTISDYLLQSGGFVIGQAVGIGILIVRAIFSRSTHIDMSLDFYDCIRPDLTPAGVDHIGAFIAPKPNMEKQA